MVAQDYPVQRAGEDESWDLDESVETLSLCDLPMYGDGDGDADVDGDGDWDDCSKDDHQSSSSDSDCFEFFSEDFTASTWPAAENIIFCGKLIPYKGLPVCKDAQKLEDNPEEKLQWPKKKGFLQRGLNSLFEEKESRSEKMDSSHGKGQKLRKAPVSKYPPHAAENYGFSPRKTGEKCDFAGPKVPILAYPPKSQWQIFFGPPRIPTEMELRHIKNRQTRRTPSKPVTSPEEGKNGGGGKRRWRSLWGLLKSLGCGTSHANTVAMASLSSIPQPQILKWVD